MRTCRRSGDKHWFDTIDFELAFCFVESVHEICAAAAINGAKAILSGNRA